MKNFDTIVFDLDGTLTDPGEGITNSVAYALKKLGIDPPPREELYAFIGPPRSESFQHYFDLTPEGAKHAISLYREYFKDKGIFENVVYPGVPQLLQRLESEGKVLLLATTKPEVFAKQVLDHFSLSKHFAFIGGSHLDGRRTKKEELIPYALQSANITDFARCIMVGDRKHDILGAVASGISSLGVLYGFGSLEELRKAGANYIAKTVAELDNYL